MFLVSFSTGTMFASAFFHLIPEAVEKIGFGIGHPSFFKIGELFHQRFTLGKYFLKKCSIKDKPFIDIRCHEMFDLKVVVRKPFPQIIED